MSRINLVCIIVGTRGTGKTDFVKKIVKKSPLPKRLIVDTFDSAPWQNLETHDHQEWMKIPVRVINYEQLSRFKKGTYRIFDSDTERLKSEIEKHVKNTLVVFEDATKHIDRTLTKPMRKFVLDTKQKNVDLVFIFHSLTAVPPELIRVADLLTLFKTGDSKRRVEQKYDNPEVTQLFESVQSHSSKYHNETIFLN